MQRHVKNCTEALFLQNPTSPEEVSSEALGSAISAVGRMEL
jgi:hypothetical protein